MATLANNSLDSHPIMMLVAGYWCLDKPVQCGVFVDYERIFQGYGFKKGPKLRI